MQKVDTIHHVNLVLKTLFWNTHHESTAFDITCEKMEDFKLYIVEGILDAVEKLSDNVYSSKMTIP